MKTATRTITIEALFNPAEVLRLDALRGGLGRSPFIRYLVQQAARTDGKSPPRPRESRGCRGPGRPASRAGAGAGIRRLI